MKRISLSNTEIENIKTFDWISYFKYNNTHLIKLDYSLDHELTDEEKKLIFQSIKAFQIGEGSDGKHLMMVVKSFAEKTNYSDYPKIMDWFILEENRHSQTLKKFMDIYGIETVKKLWIDNVFRGLRKLMGLECEIIVLVTAEMIALSYYDALADATDSKLLKDICTQMLNDELKHIVLQSDTLGRISYGRNEILNYIIRAERKILMNITSSVVWCKYKEVFRKGKYTKRLFQENCRFYLAESVAIEKYGTFRRKI